MKNYIYYICILIVGLVIFYIAGILGIIQLIFFGLIYSLIFYGVYILYKKIRKKEIKKYKNFLIDFIKKASLSTVLFGIIIGFFGYYQIYFYPAKMIEYTVSNGDKTLVFQEMSHIGAKSYYEEIRNNLKKYKENGFVYFYEGVKIGTKQENEKFNKAMGINFDEDLYKNFSKLYGVEHQDNSIYYNLVNDLDFNVDVSIGWIINKYEKENGELSLENNNKEVIDINASVVEKLSELNQRQLKILVFINKSILNFLIKSDQTQNVIKENFANTELFKIILEGRNDILAEEIINSEYKKIYVTYGKLHFKGVLEILKENDKNWEIKSKKELISIR